MFILVLFMYEFSSITFGWVKGAAFEIVKIVCFGLLKRVVHCQENGLKQLIRNNYRRSLRDG